MSTLDCSDIDAMKFQIVSDVHMDTQKKSILKIIRPSAANLIIAGDLGRVENWSIYSQTIEILCNVFKNVILVPGNHEYYSTKPIDMRIITKKLKDLQTKYYNLSVLIDECVTIDDILIYGSIFWSHFPVNNLSLPMYTTKNGFLVPITTLEYNQLHKDSVTKMNRMVQYCKDMGKRMVVVTHYAPTFIGTLAPKHAKNGKNDIKNYLYCSDNDMFLLEHVIRAWIYGHTGHNGIYGKLISNQIDAQNSMNNAVLKLPR